MTNNDYLDKPSSDNVPNYYGGGVPEGQPQQPYGFPQTGAPYGPGQPTQLPYQGQPNPYGQPYPPQPGGPYQQPQQFAPMSPYGSAPAPKSSNNAMIALIASLSTLFILWVIPVIGVVSSVFGVIFGHKALKETSDSYNSGRGIAITSLICGYMSLVLSALWSLFIVFIIIVAGTAETTTY